MEIEKYLNRIPSSQPPCRRHVVLVASFSCSENVIRETQMPSLRAIGVRCLCVTVCVYVVCVCVCVCRFVMHFREESLPGWHHHRWLIDLMHLPTFSERNAANEPTTQKRHATLLATITRANAHRCGLVSLARSSVGCSCTRYAHNATYAICAADSALHAR